MSCKEANMGDQPWLDRVRERLARRRLPPGYVQRFIEELADHLEDLKGEGMEANASSRLGEPEQLANAAVAAYRRRSFIGRRPLAAFLVFAVSPVIAQYVLFVVFATVLLTIRADHTLNWYENRWILTLTILACSTFLSILYDELATRLGIGRKWTLASCAVLGAFAMLLELGLGVPVMLPVQFAVPFAAGCWAARRKHNRSYPATTFLVFAMSPVASYMLLWFTLALAIATTTRSISLFLVLVYVVPTVMAIVLVCKLARRFSSARKWIFLSCMMLATLVAIPFMPLLLMYVVPTVVTSLLYCRLAERFGSGRKWMFVSCTVLATFAAMESFGLWINVSEDSAGFRIGLVACIVLAQFLVPLAIGWRFMRRRHDRRQLGLAS
jgi:hypothetical protein